MFARLLPESFLAKIILKMTVCLKKICLQQAKESAIINFLFGGNGPRPETCTGTGPIVRHNALERSVPIETRAKVKVIRIIARLNIGGPARHVAILSEGLNKNSYDSTLLYGNLGNGEGDMSYLAKENGIKSVFIPELVREISPVKDFLAFVRIFSIIRREKPDIVHTHTAKAGALGRIAAILAGVPVKAHTFHGHVFYGYFAGWLTRLFLWAERILAFFTDCIICVSENQKKELLNTFKIGNDKKCVVVNLGFELDDFLRKNENLNEFRLEQGIGKDEILIGAVGRLVPIKNHRMLIKTAERLKFHMRPESFSKVRFVLIGDGPEKTRLIEYAVSKGVEDKIVFAGWIKDMRQVYTGLDIVVSTSRNEGTPLSLIEAFASAKPVIATNVGGVRDVVRDIGILVDKDDEDGFARCLSDLIASPARRDEIGTKGREYIARRFSRENLIARIEKLYEKLLKKKGLRI